MYICLRYDNSFRKAMCMLDDLVRQGGAPERPNSAHRQGIPVPIAKDRCQM